MTNNDSIIQKYQFFVGFDLGHGDTCIMSVQAEGDDRPTVLEVDGPSSFPTAIAREDDNWLIGHAAVTTDEPEEFDIGFKSRPTQSKSWKSDRPLLVKYSQECHSKASRFLPDKAYDQQFIIGCPTAWNEKDIELYCKAFEEAGLPNLRVVKESRAAFIHAKDARLIPPEKLKSSIIVIDIGSSTTDVTYLKDLKVEDVIDAKESYMLGASLIDQFIYEENMKVLSSSVDWKEYFQNHPADCNEVLFTCRQLKEDYFNPRSIRKRSLGIKRIMTTLNGDLILTVNQEMVERAISTPLKRLDGQSWVQAYRKILQDIKSLLNQQPDYILLGGGASRMDFTSDICDEIFEGTTLKHDSEPQTAVASGLARLGRWEHRCNRFEQEIRTLLVADNLHEILRPHVRKALNKFVVKSFKALFAEIMPGCIDDWQSGKITASDGLLLAVRNKSIEWERSSEGKQLKNEAATDLINIVIERTKPELDSLCKRYYIPPQKLKFKLDVGNVTYVEELSNLLDEEIIKTMDRIAGELVDVLPKWDWFIKLTKGSVRLYGKFITWVAEKLDSFDEYLPESKIHMIAQDFSTSIHDQLMKQFQQQLDDILIWIQ